MRVNIVSLSGQEVRAEVPPTQNGYAANPAGFPFMQQELRSGARTLSEITRQILMASSVHFL